MGTFSELSIDSAIGTKEEALEVAPFTLEQNEPEPATETFGDEEKQAAEAETAQAALAFLKQQEDGADTAGAGAAKEATAPDASAEEMKRLHEEQEAKRKAEWEARQAAKEEAVLMEWETVVAVSDEELASASLKRVGADTERLTHRNMKVCVAEHIQTKCLEDMDFARLVMHPRKNMVNCFHYIRRKARAYAEQEMKDNGEEPVNGMYDTDVPDGLCYQWAEDYFADLDAEEDKDKDEKFVPKPYTGPKPKKAPAKKAEKKPKPEKKAEPPADGGQMSLLGGLAG